MAEMTPTLLQIPATNIQSCRSELESTNIYGGEQRNEGSIKTNSPLIQYYWSN